MFSFRPTVMEIMAAVMFKSNSESTVVDGADKITNQPYQPMSLLDFYSTNWVSLNLFLMTLPSHRRKTKTLQVLSALVLCCAATAAALLRGPNEPTCIRLPDELAFLSSPRLSRHHLETQQRT